MSSNKKILSILGFLGILAGLLIVNLLFLKISKSIVEYSKAVPSKVQIESIAGNNVDINTNAKQTLENKIIESGNGKEIISNIAFYLDNNDKKDVDNKLNSNEILNNNNNKAIEEVKQSAAFAPTNFLEINRQAANFKELNNQTIKERYPDFPSVDMDPPRESKDSPVHIPIIEKNVSEAEVTVKSGNQTIKVNNTTDVIHSERNETTEITHESVSANATASVVSDDKQTTIDVLQQNNNSTTIKISENRTIIIDLPNKNQEVTKEGKLNTTNATPIANDTLKNVSSTEEAKQSQQANITSQDTIVVVHKNETASVVDNSTVNVTQEANKEEQKITIVNQTYSANVSATDESCDFEDEEKEEQITKEAAKTNVTESVSEYDHKKEIIHKKEHKEKHYKHHKHYKSHKKHGKRCRNKKHAHYIELAEDQSANLIQESNVLDKISQENIVETVNGSSYTQAALSKMIVVDHIQTPKAEKADSEVLKAESPIAAEKPTENAASALSEKKAINK